MNCIFCGSDGCEGACEVRSSRKPRGLRMDTGIEKVLPDRVKACTVCGRVAMHSCYHDGRERSTIEMTREKALQLANRWLDALEKELRDFEAHINRYLK